MPSWRTSARADVFSAELPEILAQHHDRAHPSLFLLDNVIVGGEVDPAAAQAAL